MAKLVEKREAHISARYKSILKSLDNTWHPLDDSRVKIVREVLEWLEHPDEKLKIIHIAGTNGKTSTGAMLGSILKANGYSYGHFSSPFIISSREQICIDDVMITKSEFIVYYEKLVTCFKLHGVTANHLSYFEYFTVISLLYFADHQVDFVLFEAGLGGLRDATNAIASPLLTVFTKVSIDHQGLIGRNLTEIAENKAAIIKQGTWVIDYPGQELAVRQVLKARTAAVNAKWCEYQPDQIIIAKTTLLGLDLIINGTPGYFLSMPGAFQVHNFSIVLKVKTALEEMGYKFEQDKTREGLTNVHLLGRMDYHKDSNILFDAAHNVDGVTALVSAINAWHLKIKPTLILGVLKDKDYHGMLDTIVPIVQRIITITPSNKTRALSAEELAAELLADYPNIDVEIASDASAAISLAMRVRESSQALIVVTGSFYTLSAIQADYRI
ncbi:bifunctional folylpolyglutamate synthase/dihydrofolate synthase [Leuconostoc miyukkimchii]|uniref:bifunctional folylpolyglutamate synthase/dihydrofolate synthase n=1 Tax=Leuconostoc miyukkimchii TaxID=910540 RepID=UPI001C7D91CB|nr:Mur ligase family protein [Leuconostoc miyukkimchii]